MARSLKKGPFIDERTLDQAAHIEVLETELLEKQARIDRLEARLNRLEKKLGD